MGKGAQPQPAPPPQVITVQAPSTDIATQTANELAAAKPLIDLGQAQYNQQLPFTKTALADNLASRFGSVENAGGAGAQAVGNTVGPLAQNLATLQSQNTQIGANGALQALSNSIADAQASAASRPITGLYSPSGQDQANANLAGALVNAYRPRQAQNQVEGSNQIGPPPSYNPGMTGGFANPMSNYGLSQNYDFNANPSLVSKYINGF